MAQLNSEIIERYPKIGVFPLQSLPSLLLDQILIKIPTKPLIQLRKTCSFMNSTVEKNRKKLENRPALGILVDMRIDRDNQTFFFWNLKESNRVMVNSQFSQMLSGISIWRLTVEGLFSFTLEDALRSRGADIPFDLFEAHALSILGQIKQKCGSFVCIGLPIDIIVEIANSINTNEFSVEERLKKTELEILKTSKNHSKFRLRYNNKDRDPNILPLISNFAHVEIQMDSQRFPDFLGYVQKSNNPIALKSVQIRMIVNHPYVTIPQSLFKQIWAASWCRNNRTGCVKHKYGHCSLNWCPQYIRLLELHSQYALLVEQEDFLKQKIIFVEKSPLAMLNMLKKVLLSDDCRFLNKYDYEEEVILKKFTERNPDYNFSLLNS